MSEFKAVTLRKQVILLWTALMLIVLTMLLGCGSEQQDAPVIDNDSVQTESSDTTGDKSQKTDKETTEATHKATPSTQTGYEDLWYLSSFHSNTMQLNQEEIELYEHIYETCCFLKLKDNGVAAVSVPYRSFLTDWKKHGDEEAALLWRLDYSEYGDLVSEQTVIITLLDLSDDRNELLLHDETGDIVMTFYRNPDTSHDREEDIALYTADNDDLFETLSLDIDLDDVTICDNDTLTLKSLGTTHNDTTGQIGFLLEAENKTDDAIMSVTGLSPEYTVHGQTVTAEFPRVIPPHTTKHIFLAFSSSDVTHDLSDVHGMMHFIKYSGELATTCNVDL